MNNLTQVFFDQARANYKAALIGMQESLMHAKVNLLEALKLVPVGEIAETMREALELIEAQMKENAEKINQ